MDDITGSVWKGDASADVPEFISDFDQGQADALAALREADVFFVVTAKEGEQARAWTSSKRAYSVGTAARFFAAASRAALELGETVTSTGDGETEL